jgi:hypothetical protein
MKDTVYQRARARGTRWNSRYTAAPGLREVIRSILIEAASGRRPGYSSVSEMAIEVGLVPAENSVLPTGTSEPVAVSIENAVTLPEE